MRYSKWIQTSYTTGIEMTLWMTEPEYFYYLNAEIGVIKNI